MSYFFFDVSFFLPFRSILFPKLQRIFPEISPTHLLCFQKLSLTCSSPPPPPIQTRLQRSRIILVLLLAPSIFPLWKTFRPIKQSNSQALQQWKGHNMVVDARFFFSRSLSPREPFVAATSVTKGRKRWGSRHPTGQEFTTWLKGSYNGSPFSK